MGEREGEAYRATEKDSESSLMMLEKINHIHRIQDRIQRDLKNLKEPSPEDHDELVRQVESFVEMAERHHPTSSERQWARKQADIITQRTQELAKLTGMMTDLINRKN